MTISPIAPCVYCVIVFCLLKFLYYSTRVPVLVHRGISVWWGFIFNLLDSQTHRIFFFLKKYFAFYNGMFTFNVEWSLISGTSIKKLTHKPNKKNDNHLTNLVVFSDVVPRSVDIELKWVIILYWIEMWKWTSHYKMQKNFFHFKM